MAESQEEKIKKIFASKGIKVQEIVDKMFPNAKGSYYNRVRKTPLDRDFIKDVQSHFGIDLVTELSKGNSQDISKEYLISEAFRLHNLLEETLQSAAKDKDKIIELQEKIDQLKDEIGRKQA